MRVFLKDSLSLITMPPKRFAKMFNLNVKKEILTYSIYTKENIKKQYIDIGEVLNILDKNDLENFLDNIQEWELINKEDNIHGILTSLLTQKNTVKWIVKYYNKDITHLGNGC